MRIDLFLVKQPSVAVLIELAATDSVTALNSLTLVVVSAGDDTIHVVACVEHDLCIIAALLEQTLETFSVSLQTEAANDHTELLPDRYH